MSVARNAARLKQEYGEFERWLKDQEAFLSRIEQSHDAENWEKMLEAKVQTVEQAHKAAIDGLTRKGKKKLSANSKDVVNDVNRKLARDKAYTEAVAKAAADQADVNRLTKSLKIANSSTWTELSAEWLASIKHWFKGTKKQLKTPRDYAILMQTALTQKEQLLASSKAAVEKMKKLATVESETDLLETSVRQAHDSADAFAELLTGEFREFADALSALRKKIAPLKSALQTQLQLILKLSKDLHLMLESYEAKLRQLNAQFEGINASVVVQQGSSEFIQVILTAFQDAGLTHFPTPPSLLDSKSSCKAQRGIKSTQHEKEDVRTEWTVEESVHGDFKPLLHQRAVSIMARPDYAANLLVFHNMGTGKTCTIDLSMQTMAQYYLKNPPDGGIVPCVLLLVQNQASIPTYLKEITHRNCIDSDVMRGLMLKKTKKDNIDTHEWSFVKSTADRQVVMNVVIHRMTKRLDSVHDWNKHPKVLGVDRWELPRIGTVIVDEAHNMFNSSQMKTTSNNHAKVFLKQLLLRPDLKRIFSTGTPTLDSDRFDDLARLLDTLRIHAPVSERYSAAADLVARPEHLYEPTVDRWFVQQDGAYAWKQGAEELFKRRISGYISYMTLEQDFSVYPRFEVVWKGQSLAGGVEAAWKDGEIKVLQQGLPTKHIMCISVPSDKTRLAKERANKSDPGRIGVHFQYYEKTPIPQKWLCMKAAFDTAPTKKHFIFVHKRQTTPFTQFTKWFSKTAKVDQFILPKQEGSSAVDAFFAQPARERYMILDDEEIAHKYIDFYNDPRNTEGQYIRYVFGTLSIKEGISLFSTHYVHLVEAPSTATVFEQSIRRAARYCSMRELLHVKDWTVSVIVYIAEGSPREAAQHAIIMNRDTSPVTLAYEAMKSAAIDCHLYSALTGVDCYNKASIQQRVQEFCLDPKTGKSKLIVYNVVDHSMQITEQQCIASDCIPGGLLSYDLWDESLRLLLIEFGYEPKSLTVSGLIQQFSKNASHITYGIWNESFHTPRLTFARTVPVEVLGRWIKANPRGIGDSVLYLIESKRAAADATVVSKLHKKATAFVERVKLQMTTNATLESALLTLKSIQRVDASEKEQILSASLRLTEMGNKLKNTTK
jgi:hypothetical protein